MKNGSPDYRHTLSNRTCSKCLRVSILCPIFFPPGVMFEASGLLMLAGLSFRKGLVFKVSSFVFCLAYSFRLWLGNQCVYAIGFSVFIITRSGGEHLGKPEIRIESLELFFLIHLTRALSHCNRNCIGILCNVSLFVFFIHSLVLCLSS